jgi:hypothetical protein
VHLRMDARTFTGEGWGIVDGDPGVGGKRRGVGRRKAVRHLQSTVDLADESETPHWIDRAYGSAEELDKLITNVNPDKVGSLVLDNSPGLEMACNRLLSKDRYRHILKFRCVLRHSQMPAKVPNRLSWRVRMFFGSSICAGSCQPCDMFLL